VISVVHVDRIVQGCARLVGNQVEEIAEACLESGTFEGTYMGSPARAWPGDQILEGRSLPA
jgi:hypothetical protein